MADEAKKKADVPWSTSHALTMKLKQRTGKIRRRQGKAEIRRNRDEWRAAR
jgi:hypothetical protein